MPDQVERILDQWRAQRPDLDVSPVGVFGRVSRIERHKSIALREVYGRYDCDSGEYDVLAALRRSGPPHALRPGELARSVLVNTGTMTERLNRLEHRGLILRVRSKQDRRSVSVELTTEGASLIDAAAVDLLDVEARLLEALSESERRALTRLLGKLASTLDADQ